MMDGLPTMTETEERVIRVIAETQQIEPAKIRPDSSFEELGIDSFDGVNILFSIENEFDISVPDEAAKDLRGVADVVAGVDKLVAEKAGA